MPKFKGDLIAEHKHEGLKISLYDFPPKKKGKRRIVLHVRQNEPKKWKVDYSAAWTQSLDVRFVEK